jgi:2-oxoisovalerate dehydrogenase E2 component (dihydrolipoyl transacylase)
MHEYKLPDVGEGLTEAEIVSWRVKVGDTIAVNDIVVEIETAKSLVELPSPYAGVIAGLLVPEGETVPVGTPIIAIGEPGEALPEGGPEPSGRRAASAGERVETPAPDEPIDTNVPPEGNPTLVGYGPREGSSTRRARKHRAIPAGVGEENAHLAVQDAFTPGGGARLHDVVEPEEVAIPIGAGSAPEPVAARALAKPPVRKLAKDLGVDLGTLTPSGPDGVVTRQDVENAAETSEVSTPAQSLARPTGGDRERREPVKGVRKLMAQAMVSSAFGTPHVTEWVTVDVTRTMELVDRLKQRRDFRDVKVSPLLVLARAIVLAMRRTPEINSLWDEAAQEVVFKSYVNLGIAAATPRGLVVPNIKDAQTLTLVELAERLGQLTATAREGRTQPAEMADGTFTITNVGVFGVDSGTPIINPGESAILAFGAVRKQPWVVEGADGDEIAIRQITTLALSFDHRHIDGEKGSRFLADVAEIMSDPAAALLY